MEKCLIAFMLFLWMCFAVIFCISIFGLSVIISDNQDRPTTFIRIGESLTQRLIR